MVGVAGGAAAGLITADALSADDDWRFVAAFPAAAGTLVAQNSATGRCAYARGDGTYYTTVDMYGLAGDFRYHPGLGKEEGFMTEDEREIQRKLRGLQHAMMLYVGDPPEGPQPGLPQPTESQPVPAPPEIPQPIDPAPAPATPEDAPLDRSGDPATAPRNPSARLMPENQRHNGAEWLGPWSVVAR